jgi:VanZ family protein
MSEKYRFFLWYWLPVIIYCFLIFIQSSYPSPPHIPKIPHMDKLAHIGIYAGLGMLFFRAFRTLRWTDNVMLVMALSAISASLYGISDEIHQHFIPYRQADIVDALADMLGSVLGVYLYRLVGRKISIKSSQHLRGFQKD